jgi:hypothetical protein
VSRAAQASQNGRAVDPINQLSFFSVLKPNLFFWQLKKSFLLRKIFVFGKGCFKAGEH